MKRLYRLAWMILGQSAKDRVLREVKRRGVIAYLRFLQVSRRLTALVFALFLVLQLMMMSLIGALVTGVMHWIPDTAQQIEILFFTFLGMFLVPAIFLLVGFYEKIWYRASGAKRLVEEVQNPRD